MKRGEMVEKLATHLQHWKGNNQDATTEDVSYEVLDFLYSQGMLPPCRADFGGHGYLNSNNYCGDFIDTCDHTWEKEE